MGCGCNKGARTVVNPGARSASASTPQAAAQRPASQVMFDVMDGEGSLVASFSNPVTARAESRRVSGTVVPRTTDTPTSVSIPAGGGTNTEGL